MEQLKLNRSLSIFVEKNVIYFETIYL